ncbi:TetR/AcrR family transcriptional regulator [Dactylosporangium sp. NPDC000521]|uniref:TetR/AcrR family transcriptional regulator n=1 Tax=Dactylosporangium sp. NPDC000521 TaxID=3363975 RepID=UPI00367ADFF8
MPRQYSKGARTAATFLEAARKEFATRGYLATKVEDIARTAGRSPASFYNYFTDKADVLAALAQAFHEDTRAQIAVPYQEGRPPEEAIRRAITIFWETYRDRLGALSGVFQASMADPAFLESWRDIRRSAIDFIAHGIERAQKDGYCPGIDVRMTSSALSSMLELSCYVWLAQGGDNGDSVVDEEAAIDSLAGIWYHAIYWRPEDQDPA